VTVVTVVASAMPPTDKDIADLQILLRSFNHTWATCPLSDFIVERRLVCNHRLATTLEAVVRDHPELKDLTIGEIQQMGATQPNWHDLLLDGVMELQDLLRDANEDQENWTVSKFIDACECEDTEDSRNKGADVLAIVNRRPFFKLRTVLEIRELKTD
jgi:hypothetical protein